MPTDFREDHISELETDEMATRFVLLVTRAPVFSDKDQKKKKRKDVFKETFSSLIQN